MYVLGDKKTNAITSVCELDWSQDSSVEEFLSSSHGEVDHVIATGTIHQHVLLLLQIFALDAPFYISHSKLPMRQTFCL